VGGWVWRGKKKAGQVWGENLSSGGAGRLHDALDLERESRIKSLQGVKYREKQLRRRRNVGRVVEQTDAAHGCGGEGKDLAAKVDLEQLQTMPHRQREQGCIWRLGHLPRSGLTT